MSILVLIRGLPGSGKSTLARQFVKNGFTHLEADMYFIDAIGNYNYKREDIGAAHNQCQQLTEDAMRHKANVVVANTFVRIAEMKPYVDLATKYNYKLIVLTCTGTYKNIHNVPQKTIDAMWVNWETV